jgi:hypothetical protein
VRVVVGGRESGFQFENDVFVVFFAGGLTESLVPLVGTSLHVNSRVQNLSLREPADEKRTEIPEDNKGDVNCITFCFKKLVCGGVTNL